ncbi:hypothetical protein [Bernardetia sp.]|uniref:hypothetical protein n=1 Tax=Bernardetia sp. TaxID=1937974 RepID=UPI0025BFB5FF|nr:hypothetical protein [Bernardetia sp.]
MTKRYRFIRFDTKERAEYEKIIFDIFDHLFAAVPYFNSELFEAIFDRLEGGRGK